MNSQWIAIAAGTLVAPALIIQTGSAQTAADWPSYNRDLAATRYSALKQINAGNVSKLAQAWTYRLRPDANSPPAGTMNEVTPIVVNGVCIFPREIVWWLWTRIRAAKSGVMS
jgi:quinoprotein glucose dehydrogenase